jgi:hypothetical protein
MGAAMCLMCEEEDLYFLYLEQRERERQRERGETNPANPNWLWPNFVTAPATTAAPAQDATPERVAATPAFTCDPVE